MPSLLQTYTLKPLLKHLNLRKPLINLRFQVSLLRSDGLDATVMNLGEPLWNTLESEAESSTEQTFHKPHRYGTLLVQL